MTGDRERRWRLSGHAPPGIDAADLDALPADERAGFVALEPRGKAAEDAVARVRRVRSCPIAAAPRSA